MNEKIAVGEAVEGGYRLVFSRLGAVIGVAWLPVLISLALSTAATLWTTRALSGPVTTAADFHDHMRSLFYAYPLYLLIGLVFGSMVSAGMMEVALGRRQRSWFYFSFGAPVRRLMAANFIVDLVLIVVGAALLAVFIGAAMAAGFAPPKTVTSFTDWLTYPFSRFMACAILPSSCPPLSSRIGLIVLAVADCCALLYIAVRFTFFLAAVAVAEERAAVMRAWLLGGRNFWRMLAVLAAVLLPLGLVVSIASHMAVQPLEAYAIAHGFTRADQVAALALARSGAPALLLIGLVFDFVQRILALGLMSGAAATAYTEVTAPKEPQV